MPKVPASGQVPSHMQVAREPEQLKPVPHPAKWSPQILEALDQMIPPGVYLDPYAGTGGIHALTRPNRRFVTVEIEPEWAEQHPETVCADSLTLMKVWKQSGTRFDGVVSSPVYGNRMSDHHEAKDASRRRGYRFQLGRMPSRESSATLYFWQPQYATHHNLMVKRISQVVRPGGLVFWNVKNFYRSKGGIEYEQDVVGYFMEAFKKRGFRIQGTVEVKTPGFREGENGEVRKDGEVIIMAVKGK